jgi:hypothetical protein
VDVLAVVLSLGALANGGDLVLVVGAEVDAAATQFVWS